MISNGVLEDGRLRQLGFWFSSDEILSRLMDSHIRGLMRLPSQMGILTMARTF